MFTLATCPVSDGMLAGLEMKYTQFPVINLGAPTKQYNEIDFIICFVASPRLKQALAWELVKL